MERSLTLNLPEFVPHNEVILALIFLAQYIVLFKIVGEKNSFLCIFRAEICGRFTKYGFSSPGILLVEHGQRA